MKETSVSTGQDYQAEGYQAVSALCVNSSVNDSTKMTVEECLPPEDTKAKEMFKTAHFVWLNLLKKCCVTFVRSTYQLHNLMVKANQVFYKNKSTCI